MKKFLFFSVGLVILAGTAFLLAKNSNQSANTPSSVTQTQMTDPKKEESPQGSASAGKYVDYAPTEITNAPEDQKLVLFFHAPWCPTCRQLNSNLKDNVSNIPPDVKIIKVDYDSSTDLKKQYNVKVQHTLVRVNNKGEMLLSWHGSPDLDSVLKKL